MTSTQLDFGEWWTDFLRNGGGREDSADTIGRLNEFARQLPPGKREAFVAELAELGCSGREFSHLALGALETLADHASRRRIAATATTLPEVHPPHPFGDLRTALLRVLARGPAEDTLGLVDSYCNGHIGPSYTSVVWALWPHHRDKFARYHARYFAETASTEWSGTAVIQAFVATPEALSALRQVMAPASPDAWRRVCAEARRQSSGSWVAPWQTEAVKRICEGAA